MPTIGTCSKCNGPVQVPDLWGGTVPPVPTCAHCGATAKDPYGPIMVTMRPIPMEKRSPSRTGAQQPAAVGVEWPLSLLRAGHWREVYVGHRCMRLEVTYERATWERLMEQVEAALSQQPAAVDEAYPTPRNRAEAVALARLALAHLGVIDAHIDAAIARCETDLAAQPQGDK